MRRLQFFILLYGPTEKTENRFSSETDLRPVKIKLSVAKWKSGAT